MKILELATNILHEVVIDEIDPKEIKRLTVKRYFFDWKKVDKQSKIYKLRIVGENDIKRVIALFDFPTESRIEIKLLTASRENVVYGNDKGKKVKEFDNIIGNLIAFACQKAISKHGQDACVSLVPKTTLRNHYLKKYGMIDGGYQLYILFDQLNNLIKKYIL